ncbi:hypothetical protein C8Q78DRAFT_994414 [Trametes maxima]|nr:hypothetical protein C8Q78DRAFT_994414 [Trametes maxima]
MDANTNPDTQSLNTRNHDADMDVVLAPLPTNVALSPDVSSPHATALGFRVSDIDMDAIPSPSPMGATMPNDAPNPTVAPSYVSDVGIEPIPSHSPMNATTLSDTSSLHQAPLDSHISDVDMDALLSFSPNSPAASAIALTPSSIPFKPHSGDINMDTTPSRLSMNATAPFVSDHDVEMNAMPSCSLTDTVESVVSSSSRSFGVDMPAILPRQDANPEAATHPDGYNPHCDTRIPDVRVTAVSSPSSISITAAVGAPGPITSSFRAHITDVHTQVPTPSALTDNAATPAATTLAHVAVPDSPRAGMCITTAPPSTDLTGIREAMISIPDSPILGNDLLFDGPAARQRTRSPSSDDSSMTNLMSSFADWRLESPPSTPASTVKKELDRSPEVTNSSFTRLASEVSRQQDGLRKTIDVLEHEIMLVRTQVSSSLERSTQLLLKTQQSIISERKMMDRQHEIVANSIQVLETKLATAQRHIATLQAQHLADRGLLEKLSNEITSLWSRQEDIGGRLRHAEESEEHVRSMTDRIRELVHDIESHDIEAYDHKSIACVSLAQELSRELDTPLSAYSDRTVVVRRWTHML